MRKFELTYVKLIAAVEDGFATIQFSDLPFPPTCSQRKIKLLEVTGFVPPSLDEKRFNDGAVDPAGRFLAGTMGWEHGSTTGQLYSLQCTNGRQYTSQIVLRGITCTNGMAWSADAKTM
jgi:sugar lactone lactonase YvrE